MLWHRIYLIQLEQALRSIHPDVTLPYWDWTQTSEQSIPGWLNGFLPTVVTPTQTINVTRFPQSGVSLATIASNTPNALAQGDFTSFTSLLQGIHNSVHVWVGGSMGSVPTTPANPLHAKQVAGRKSDVSDAHRCFCLLLHNSSLTPECAFYFLSAVWPQHPHGNPATQLSITLHRMAD